VLLVVVDGFDVGLVVWFGVAGGVCEGVTVGFVVVGEGWLVGVGF